MQITPFFLAYVTGVYFSASALKVDVSIGGRVILPALSFAPGFAAVYALLTMTGMPVGRTLVYNLGTLGFIAGLYILLVSLSLALLGRVTNLGFLLRAPVLAAVSFVLGSAFALIYSPCITPALSEILGLAARPGTSVQGGTLAFFYGFGICLALTISGAALAYLLPKIKAVRQNPRLAKDVCAFVLFALAGLNLSGTMIYYKAFFLGFMVK